MISKYQLLIRPGDIKLPIHLRIIGFIIAFFFYPLNLFKKPDKAFGARFKLCLEHLGPIYIKFGQTLSTRPDLIGTDVAKHLTLLQDRLAPFDINIAKQIIFKSLDRTHDDLFSYFNEEPIAAASISQVHYARLKTGEEVAVKILRPNIHKIYEKDIKLLHFLAKKISKFVKKSRRLKLREMVNIFEQAMHNELDLRLEAAACDEMRNNFSEDLNVHIPKVYWQETSENVLTTEWVDGVSIYDIDGIKALNLVPEEISRKIAVIFFNQVYRDGFFHADLHPGNILVRKDSSIALLDFGIVGRLSEGDRLAIAEIFYAFTSKNYKLVAEVHRRAGYIPKHTDLDLFAQNCRAICEPIIGFALKDIFIGKLLAQLFMVTEKFGMEAQPQLLLLQKTMVVVEGIGQSLNNDINMWQLAEPWIKKWAAKNLSPEAKVLRLIKKVIVDISRKL